MRISLAGLVLALCLPLPLLAANTPASAPPDQVIKQAVEQVFAAVNQNRATLAQNPSELDNLVGKILLPHFDFDVASRLVLGRYWRTATPAQRKAFQDALYKFLVNSYANALLKGNFSARNIQVDPWRGEPSDTRAMIRTKVSRPNASPVQVDYAMLRTQDGWKAFDVSIEGVSYVLNYRNQFGPEIEQKGLNALIERLNAEASRPPTARTHVPAGT
ncbi:MAG: MlaC/ttg2D family ABC transporter substrate-binding protein [Gammaproteobacteria bacterium]